MRNGLLGFVFLAMIGAGAPAFGQVAREKAPRAGTPREGAAADPARVPADAAAEGDAEARPDLTLLNIPSLAYGVFEVGSHWRGKEEAGLDLLCSAHPIIIAGEPFELARRAGVSPKRVERILMTMGRGRMILATTFSDAEAEAALRKAQFPGGTTEMAGDRRILLGGSKGLAGYDLTDHVLVVGDAPEIRKLAEEPPPPTNNPFVLGFRDVLVRSKPL
jgi:hypothetical protein